MPVAIIFIYCSYQMFVLPGEYELTVIPCNLPTHCDIAICIIMGVKHALKGGTNHLAKASYTVEVYTSLKMTAQNSLS